MTVYEKIKTSSIDDIADKLNTFLYCASCPFQHRCEAYMENEVCRENCLITIKEYLNSEVRNEEL